MVINQTILCTSNTTLHVVGRRTDTLRHNRHFAGHRGERNSIKPRSATKPKGPVQLGNPIIRAFMQVQLNVGRRYLSLEHTAHSPMYNRHCTNLHHDLGDSHHMNARNARHKILPHLWYVGLKTASSRWHRAALSPTTSIALQRAAPNNKIIANRESEGHQPNVDYNPRSPPYNHCTA